MYRSKREGQIEPLALIETENEETKEEDSLWVMTDTEIDGSKKEKESSIELMAMTETEIGGTERETDIIM